MRTLRSSRPVRLTGRALGCGAVLAASVVCAFQPACADPLSDVRAGMAASVTSMRIVTSSPLGFSNTMTIVTHPRRAHMVMTVGPITIEIYLVDNIIYQRLGSGDWQKRTLPADAALLDLMKTFVDLSQMTVGPDETDGGTVYGTLQLDVNPAQLPGMLQTMATPNIKLVCTYDKSTYRMHQCKNDLATETFEGYNDPENVIVLPAALDDAVDAGPFVMPGTSVPSPLPTP
jgi:hypothetical protein